VISKDFTIASLNVSLLLEFGYFFESSRLEAKAPTSKPIWKVL
jgi:hypothetical protein